MKIYPFLLFCFISVYAISQEVVKDFYLKKSLKQNGLHLQFTVLDEGKRGVWHYQRSNYYFWYKAQKVLSTQGGASGQLLHGNFEAFYENKQLAQKGKFCRGLKDGEWLYWRPDGSLSLVEVWKKGKFSGKQVVYGEDGAIKEEVEYGMFRTKLFRGDSSFVIKRKYAKGEVGSWMMEHGTWTLRPVRQAQGNQAQGPPFNKRRERPSTSKAPSTHSTHSTSSGEPGSGTDRSKGTMDDGKRMKDTSKGSSTEKMKDSKSIEGEKEGKRLWEKLKFWDPSTGSGTERSKGTMEDGKRMKDTSKGSSTKKTNDSKSKESKREKKPSQGSRNKN